MSPEFTGVDEEAFRLVQEHQTMLKAFVEFIVPDPRLVEDTLSDVTLAILSSWESFDQARSFPVWARGIAWRVARNNARTEKRQPCPLDNEALELAAEDQQESWPDPLDETKELVEGCVDRLPPFHREFIRLRYYDDRSYAEVSGMMGKTVACLYVGFNRARKLLSVCLERKLQRP